MIFSSDDKQQYFSCSDILKDWGFFCKDKSLEIIKWRKYNANLLFWSFDAFYPTKTGLIHCVVYFSNTFYHTAEFQGVPLNIPFKRYIHCIDFGRFSICWSQMVVETSKKYSEAIAICFGLPPKKSPVARTFMEV